MPPWHRRQRRGNTMRQCPHCGRTPHRQAIPAPGRIIWLNTCWCDRLKCRSCGQAVPATATICRCGSELPAWRNPDRT